MFKPLFIRDLKHSNKKLQGILLLLGFLYYFFVVSETENVHGCINCNDRKHVLRLTPVYFNCFHT